MTHGIRLVSPPGHNVACMVFPTPGMHLENGEAVFPVAPNGSRRDTLRFGAEPFIRREERAPREGIARYKLRYTPYVKRGFLRKHWTIDRHVWLESDPFELITPGFER